MKRNLYCEEITMATFTTYVPVNMLTLTPFVGVPTVTTSSKLVIEAAGEKIVYLGTFTYYPDGSVSGNVDTMRHYQLGVLVDKATGLNKDIGALMVAADAGGASFLTYIMGDSDVINGSGGDDVLVGLGGRDFMFGKGGNDTLFGGDEGDNLYGEKGNDFLSGEKGSDDLFGGKGSDKLSGGGGGDYLDGGAGRDKIYGNNGDDGLFGGDGNDRLFGGAGDDFISGNAGNDILKGGTGADEFAFYAGDGTDRVKDFTDGEDAVWLVTYGFASAADVIALASFDGTDTTFDFGGGDTLTLLNFDSANLDASDFVL